MKTLKNFLCDDFSHYWKLNPPPTLNVFSIREVLINKQGSCLQRARGF